MLGGGLWPLSPRYLVVAAGFGRGFGKRHWWFLGDSETIQLIYAATFVVNAAILVWIRRAFEVSGGGR